MGIMNCIQCLIRKEITQRDSCLSWLALVASVCIFCTSVGFMWSFGLIFNALLDEYKASKEKTAWIGSIPIALAYILSPVCLLAARKVSVRLGIIIGTTFTGTSFIATSFATNINVVFFTFSLLYGVGFSFLIMNTNKSIALYFDKRYAIADGLLTGGTCLLQIPVTRVLIVLLENYSLQKTLQIYGAGSTLICLVGSLAYFPTNYEAAEEKCPAQTKNEESPMKKCKLLLKNKLFCLWLFAAAIIMLEYSVSSVHQVQFALESGVSEKVARQFPFYSAISSGIGRFTAGFVFDLKRLDKVYTYQVILLLTGLISLLGSMSTSQSHLVAFIWVFAIFDGMCQCAAFPTMKSIIGLDVMSEAMSLTFLISGVTMMMGPPIVGAIVDKTTSYKAFFYVAGIPLIVGALILFLYRFMKEFKALGDLKQIESGKILTSEIGIMTGGMCLLQIPLSRIFVGLLENYSLQKTLQIYAGASTAVCLLGSLAYLPTRFETDEKVQTEINKGNEESSITKYKSLMESKVPCVWTMIYIIVCTKYSVSTVHQVQFALESGVSENVANQFPFYSAIGASIGRMLSGFVFDMRWLDKQQRDRKRRKTKMGIMNCIQCLIRKEVTQRDSCLSWLALAASVCIFCTSLGFMWSFGLIFNALLDEYKASKEKTAWIGSIPFALAFIFSPVCLLAARKVSVRLGIIIGTTFTGTSFIATSFATNINLVFFTFSLLYGVGFSFLIMNTNKSIALYFDKRYAIANGLLTGGTCLLQIPVTRVLIALLENYSLQKTLQIYGAGSTLICLVGSLAYFPTNYEAAEEKCPAQTKNEDSPMTKCKLLLKNKLFCLWLFAAAIIMLEYSVSSVHQVQFALESGVSEKVARQFPFYSAISSSIGRITAGFVFDLKRLDKVYTYQVILLLTGLISLLGSMSTSQSHLVAFIWVFAIFDGMCQCAAFPTMKSIIGLDVMSEAMSLTFLISGVTMMMGPPIVGVIVDKTKSYKAFFYVAGIPLIVGALILFLYRFMKEFKALRDVKQIESDKILNSEIGPAQDKQEKENIFLLQLESNV
eukprot:gene6309-7031_t